MVSGFILVVKKTLNPCFQRLSSRACKTVVDSRKLHVISVYAQTLKYYEDHPEEREELYNIIQAAYKQIPNRDYFVIGGNFNAKVGTKWYEYPDNLGRHGKGTMNSSGKCLLEFCAENDLIITNTIFKHKAAHITTWTDPFRKFMQNGTRRNPMRNQIDFIITKINHKCFLKDSRAHGGIITDADHKLVKTSFEIKWYTKNNNTKKQLNINYNNFSNTSMRNQYQQEIDNQIDEKLSPQEKWNKTCNILHSIAENVLG